ACAQNLFFRLTRGTRLEPKETRLSWAEGGKPDDEQSENSLETIAHRFVEGLMRRGPLDEAEKKKAAQMVHYLYGALWGGLYGLTRESLPRVPPQAFGALVWMLSENVLLPAFRVSAWPQKYSLSEHRYALQA